MVIPKDAEGKQHGHPSVYRANTMAFKVRA